MDQQQQSRRRPTRTQVTWIGIGVVAGLFAAIVVFGGYYFEWKWTGFPKQTLWDWLKLLIVPVVLALGGYLFTRSENQRTQNIADQQRDLDRQIADGRRQDDTLQTYLEGMSQLLTDKDRPLHRAQVSDSLSTAARARTLTVLTRLDGMRKGNVLQFLYESGLIDAARRVLDLKGADLSATKLPDIDLSHVYLSGANLSDANLSNALLVNASLSGVNLSDANLSYATVVGTDLTRALLRGANLSDANLSDAHLVNANLRHAELLHSALRNAQLKDAVLEHADLSSADLGGRADLRGANLSYANLNGADLNGADLGDAVLSGANLSGANLLLTNLSDANLGGADLHRADLSGANLYHTNLSGADLSGAALRRVQYLIDANLSGADLSDANLSGVGGKNHPTSALSLSKMPNPGDLMSHEELEQKQAATLKGVTFPSGYKYEDQLPGGQTYGDWLAEQKARAKDGENSGPS